MNRRVLLITLATVTPFLLTTCVWVPTVRYRGDQPLYLAAYLDRMDTLRQQRARIAADLATVAAQLDDADLPPQERQSLTARSAHLNIVRQQLQVEPPAPDPKQFWRGLKYDWAMPSMRLRDGKLGEMRITERRPGGKTWVESRGFTTRIYWWGILLEQLVILLFGAGLLMWLRLRERRKELIRDNTPAALPVERGST